MRLPRGLTGAKLIQALERVGYAATRQTGGHVRLTRPLPEAHHVTVPLHDPLRIGTLASIIAAVAQANGFERDELMHRLFD